MMKCSVCDKVVKEDDKFCSYCGSKLELVEKSQVNEVKQNNNGNISLVFGILSCALFLIPFMSVPFGIIAIIVGYFYKKETHNKTAGFILGIVGVILTILLIIFLTVICYLIITNSSDYDSDYYNHDRDGFISNDYIDNFY